VHKKIVSAAWHASAGNMSIAQISDVAGAEPSNTARRPFGAVVAAAAVEPGNTGVAAAAAATAAYTAAASKQQTAPVCQTVTSLEETGDDTRSWQANPDRARQRSFHPPRSILQHNLSVLCRFQLCVQLRNLVCL